MSALASSPSPSPPDNTSPSPPSTSGNGGCGNGGGDNSNIYDDWYSGDDYSQQYDNDCGAYDDYNRSSKEIMDGIPTTSDGVTMVVIIARIITSDDVLMIREYLLGHKSHFFVQAT